MSYAENFEDKGGIINRKNVQLVDVIHMLIGSTDIFAKHTKESNGS